MITGWNALVTGGSSGIGAAIAEGLAAAGTAADVDLLVHSAGRGWARGSGDDGWAGH